MQRRPDVLAAFDALAPQSDIAALLCDHAGGGYLAEAVPLSALCTKLRLPQARGAQVERALVSAMAVGLFERPTTLTWRASNPKLAAELAPLLHGASLYRSRVHQDDNVVDVVLTKPPSPSQMAAQLERILVGSWGLRDTKELLPSIAESANQSFTVMTPYLDDVGASIVLNLFDRAEKCEKVLILRCGSDGRAPPGLHGIRAELAARAVEVLNFRIDRQEGVGNETFHAKVVMADNVAAYVGSSNMHKWSFEYSLELGVFVRGQAVQRIADILAAVRAVAEPMP